MRKENRQAGYALLTVVFLVALVALSLAVAAPSAATHRKRQMEEELIFRGEQYQRAIMLYYRAFGRLPMKVDDLLRTNDRSFLRREWPDPMTQDGKWRLIRLGPGGQLVGSIVQQAPADPLGRRGGSAPPPTGFSSGIETLPLIGVASNSTEKSFRVYNDQETYAGWEFLFDPRDLRQGGTPGQTGPNPATPGNGGERQREQQQQRPPAQRPPG